MLSSIYRSSYASGCAFPTIKFLKSLVTFYRKRPILSWFSSGKPVRPILSCTSGWIHVMDPMGGKRSCWVDSIKDSSCPTDSGLAVSCPQTRYTGVGKFTSGPRHAMILCHKSLEGLSRLYVIVLCCNLRLVLVVEDKVSSYIFVADS
jgi:hypothetical protein